MQQVNLKKHPSFAMGRMRGIIPQLNSPSYEAAALRLRQASLAGGLPLSDTIHGRMLQQQHDNLALRRMYRSQNAMLGMADPMIGLVPQVAPWDLEQMALSKSAAMSARSAMIQNLAYQNAVERSLLEAYLAEGQKTMGMPSSASLSGADCVDLTENDVLCGRGGITNSHPGNLRFRALVRQRKMAYINAVKRCDKPRIARQIVFKIRQMGGRFLERSRSGTWQIVDDARAAKKVSQALREGAPEMRKKAEKGDDASDSESDGRKSADSSASKASLMPIDGAQAASPSLDADQDASQGLDLLQEAAQLKAFMDRRRKKLAMSSAK